MRIVSVVGARPEFIQAAPVSRALRTRHEEVLVHTGQHYDVSMSQAIFDELGIPPPDHNLGVGSASHGRQTAAMLWRLEEVLVREAPDAVIVRGDTNSTLAGTLAASKLNIPLVHVEAGERRYRRQMPEEVNRIAADALATLHLCASMRAVDNLQREGIARSVHWVGDVMLDALLQNLPVAREVSTVLDRLGLEPGGYSLAAAHRAANVDDPARLRAMVETLNGAPERVVFPVHPRTRGALDRLGCPLGQHITLTEPATCLDMLVLEENTRLIVTDSGGVQREAYHLRVPCLTLRDETEWQEAVSSNWNRLVGVAPERVLAAWHDMAPPAEHPAYYGEGRASQRIAEIVGDPLRWSAVPGGAERGQGVPADSEAREAVT